MLDLINSFTNGSKFSRSNLDRFFILLVNSAIIFFDAASINFKSSLLNWTLSKSKYFGLSGWPNLFYPKTDVPYIYFAASCGGVSEVDQEMIDIVGKAKFRGFRDSETADMFNLEYDLVPDPTFLIDIGNYVNVSVPFEKIELNDGRHHYQKNLNPLEWFHSFSMFSYVITDRMHPSVACLKYGTNFHTKDKRFKTKEVIKTFDLKNFILLFLKNFSKP